MELPSLFHVAPEPRYRKYLKIGLPIVFVSLAVLLALAILFRFHSEQTVADQFLNLVIAGEYQPAYKLWHAGASYAYSDFLQDWGPKGYYGPVRSFKVVALDEPKDSSGVIVVVDLSPYSPFPTDDLQKELKTKEVRLWVQFSDKSISYAP